VDIPIDIPGFDQFIPILPFGAVIFIKGGVDPAKTFFALHLIEAANKAGRFVNVISSRSGMEVRELIQEYFPTAVRTNIIEASEVDIINDVHPDSLVVVDSFSFLMLENDLKLTSSKIREMKAASQRTNSLFVLVIDDGMLDDRTEAVLLHFADGLIKFMSADNPEGLKRFMRIPLWINGTSFDDNIFYTFNDGRLSVDLRYRVV
jgi:KaiC/GvpD/RAD55 family RecA-like ATPase